MTIVAALVMLASHAAIAGHRHHHSNGILRTNNDNDDAGIDGDDNDDDDDDDDNITKVYVVFSNHLDVGYTLNSDGSSAGAVVNEYFDKHFPKAVETGRAARAAGRFQYRWMTQSWLVDVFRNCNATVINIAGPGAASDVRCPNASALAAFDEAVRVGDITWHAFPFNAEPETFATTELLDAAFDTTFRQDDHYAHARRRTLSQRDVPGLTRALLPHLARHNVTALSIGENSQVAPVNVPDLFRWVDNTTGASAVALFHKLGYGRRQRQRQRKRRRRRRRLRGNGSGNGHGNGHGNGNGDGSGNGSEGGHGDVSIDGAGLGDGVVIVETLAADYDDAAAATEDCSAGSSCVDDAETLVYVDEGGQAVFKDGVDPWDDGPGMHVVFGDNDGDETVVVASRSSHCVEVPAAGAALCYAWRIDNSGPHSYDEAALLVDAVELLFPKAAGEDRRKEGRGVVASDAFDDFIEEIGAWCGSRCHCCRGVECGVLVSVCFLATNQPHV
mgnify:CR=1 FL=1